MGDIHAFRHPVSLFSVILYKALKLKFVFQESPFPIEKKKKTRKKEKKICWQL